MLRLKTEKYFILLIFILMGMVFLPVVSNHLPAYIGSWKIWLLIFEISLVLLKPKVIWNKLVLIVLIYGLFLFLMLQSIWIGMDEWNKENLKTEYLAILLAISFISYFKVSQDFKGLAIVTKYVLIFIGITAIMTIYVSYVFPMYARLLFMENYEGDIARELAFRFGAGDYGLVLVFVAIIPVLIFYYKNDHLFFLKEKWAIGLFILILAIAIIRMQLFANILVGFLFSIIAFLSVKKRVRNSIIIGIIAFVFVIIPQSVYINTLYGLSESTKGIEDVSYKFKEFAVYLETGGDFKNNELSYRAARFPMLWAAFKQSPLLGCYYPSEAFGFGYKQEGAHLYWMNKLAVTGIVGFLFYISILIVFIRSQLKNIKGEFVYYFILALLTIIIYGVFKNVLGRTVWLVFFLILPGMYYLPLLQKNKKNEIEENL